MKQKLCNSWKYAGVPTFNPFPIISNVIGLLNFSVVLDKLSTSLIDEDAAYEKNIDIQFLNKRGCIVK